MIISYAISGDRATARRRPRPTLEALVTLVTTTEAGVGLADAMILAATPCLKGVLAAKEAIVVPSGYSPAAVKTVRNVTSPVPGGGGGLGGGGGALGGCDGGDGGLGAKSGCASRQSRPESPVIRSFWSSNAARVICPAFSAAKLVVLGLDNQCERLKPVAPSTIAAWYCEIVSGMWSCFRICFGCK